MKVSMLGTLPPTKGISDYILGLVKGLSKEVEIEFFGFKSIYPKFLYTEGTETDEEIPRIDNVKINNYITWYNPFSWVKTGFSISSNIVHAQWWSWVLAPVYVTVLGIAKLRNKKVIMTLHNVKPHEKSFIKNFLNNSVIGLADEYIVHSKNNKELFLELTKTKKTVHIIPHGVITIKKSDIPKTVLRKKYGFLDNDKVILLFGGIRDYKGVDILLKSLSEINESQVKLIIAGKAWTSFEKYQSLINELKLERRVKLFLGFIPNAKLAELFKISDLSVLPYKEFEASSGVGTVALNFEKPLVITQVGGLPELVKDKKGMAKPNDYKDLTKAIAYSLNNLVKLGKDSKEKAKEFSWNKITEKTIRVYQNE